MHILLLYESYVVRNTIYIYDSSMDNLEYVYCMYIMLLLLLLEQEQSSYLVVAVAVVAVVLEQECGLGEGKTGSFVIARAGAVQCSYSDRRGGREGRERERERQAGAPRMQTTRTTLECITRSSINISNITRVL